MLSQNLLVYIPFLSVVFSGRLPSKMALDVDKKILCIEN